MGKYKRGFLKLLGDQRGVVSQFLILALLVLGAGVLVYTSQQKIGSLPQAFTRYQTAQEAGRTYTRVLAPTAAPVQSNSNLSSPSGLTATQLTNTRIKLSWQAVSGANSYRVFRNGTFIGQASGGMGAQGLIPATEFTDSLVDCGQSYEYQISTVTANTGQSEAEIAQGQSGLSVKTSINTTACNSTQTGVPVCNSISGPETVKLNTFATFTFNYSGKVNAVQWSTTGSTWTEDGLYKPNGTLYPPETLTIRWQYSNPGTYQIKGYVYDGNFTQGQCPVKTVTVQ